MSVKGGLSGRSSFISGGLMQVSGRRFWNLLPAIAMGLSLLLLADSALAQRGGGGRGGGKRGGGRGQAVQQKQGKPAEVRFLRVCRALTLEEDQLENAKTAFDSMGIKKAKILEEQQLGAISSLAARQEIRKLGEKFEEKFIAMLNEEQLKKLEKLKQDGTLNEQWW